MATKVHKKDIPEDRRVQQMRTFVDRTAWAGSPLIPLCIDTSVRRFYRVAKGKNTAVLMDARPPLEDTTIFETMQKKLSTIGLSVPELYVCDHEHGLVLMEDFGDERYYELVSEKRGDVKQLYTLAVDALVHKYFADPAVALEQSVAYSDEYWLFRVEQFLLHYMPHALGRTATIGEREDFLGLFREAINATHKFNPVLLHGDYGAQNLYYLPDRPGIKALGMIDFQDLTDARGNMMGSPAFDLVFLLQDVRVDLPATLEAAMRQRFIEKTGIKEVSDFEGVYATIGTAQATKCLGLFARFGYGNKRTEYLKFIPYCWRNLERNLSHPDLKGIRDWFTKNKIDIQKGLS
ncbi:MAG: phosphotransferase [Proteobacteria bacterium]|nr:phosphotransferase [Pseudomonadota bacterium]